MRKKRKIELAPGYMTMRDAADFIKKSVPYVYKYKGHLETALVGNLLLVRRDSLKNLPCFDPMRAKPGAGARK